MSSPHAWHYSPAPQPRRRLSRAARGLALGVLRGAALFAAGAAFWGCVALAVAAGANP